MNIKIIGLVVMGLFSAASVRAQFNWQQYAGNPVLSEANVDDADNTSYYKYLFEPSVFFDTKTNSYRTWFVSLGYGYGTRFCVSEATSLDGTDWYLSVRNPVLHGGEPGSFDDNLRAPRVIYNGSEYRMYYTGWANFQHYRIGLAVSSDGKTWTRRSAPVLPLGPTGSWDSNEHAYCDVHFDGTTYSMWYSGSDATHEAIGLATSTDGITWTKYAGNPVFQASSSGWDSFVVLYPMITRVDSLYYMVYRGNSMNTENYRLGVAYSEDGIHWTRSASNPIISPSSGWEGTSIDGGTLLFRENEFHLWYCALSSLTGHWQTGYATANHGPLGVAPLQNAAQRFSLSEAYPNPFNPETVLEYSLATGTHVTIKVFDVLGKEVETLVDEQKEKGTYAIRWKPLQAASGVYWCRMSADNYSESRKIILLK